MTPQRAILAACALAALCLAYVYSGFRTPTDDPILYYRTSGTLLGAPTRIYAYEYPDDTPAHTAARRALLAAGGSMIVKVPQQVPYRDFDAEYPPAAFALFLLPRLLTDERETYINLFAALMTAALALAALAGWRMLKPTRVRPVTYAVACLLWFAAAGPLALMRFDAVVVAALAWSVAFLLERRWLPAGLLLGLAAALKVWPVFLAGPLLFLLWNTGRWRALLTVYGAAAALVLATHLALLPWTGPAVFNYLSYHGARGLQVESTWALLAGITARAQGWPVQVANGFGSDQLQLPGHSLAPFLSASYLAMIAGNLLCCFAGWRAARAPTVARTNALLAATIGLLVLSAKVFSVQYGFWLFPMTLVFALRRGRVGYIAAAAYLASLALAHAWYPAHFDPIMQVTPLGLTLLATRDTLLLLTTTLALHTTLTPDPTPTPLAPQPP